MKCELCEKKTDLTAVGMCHDCYMASDLSKQHSESSVFAGHTEEMEQEMAELMQRLGEADTPEEKKDIKYQIQQIKLKFKKTMRGPKKRQYQIAFSSVAVVTLTMAGYFAFTYFLIVDEKELQTNITEPLESEDVLDPTFLEEEEPPPEEPESNFYKDSDGDGIPDGKEVKVNTDPNNADSDGDMLNDYDEIVLYRTDPNDADTDDGGIGDGVEISQESNPNDPSDDI